MAVPQLHHRRELYDMRTAYDSERSFHSDRDSDRSYQQSQSSSGKSYSTQPTVYSEASPKRPARVHYNTCDHELDSPPQYFADRHPQESPRASVETYASTVPSEDDFQEELPEYEVPEYTAQPYASQAVAATPSDFSELFPSHRRMCIRHDDSTLDGNMNLRIDTEVIIHGGRRCNMTLFHLRMHDLRNREFSLRRYCRDSGREVCHSARKQQKPSEPKRPGFQRSLSNAFSHMRSKSEQKSPTVANLTRNDSGYASGQSSIDFDCEQRPNTAYAGASSAQPVDMKSMKLEFSNYAQVDLKRAGSKGSKRYDFEYWGTQYSWKRVVKKDGESHAQSYHLVKQGHERVLAYIIPSPLTRSQAEDEQRKGGWVHPCSMWIADEHIVRGQKDVADVIVSTGLMALVDDAIKMRFQCQDSKALVVPKFGVEYVGPKRLINEMFSREGSSSHSRSPSNASRPGTRRASSAARPVSNDQRR